MAHSKKTKRGAKTSGAKNTTSSTKLGGYFQHPPSFSFRRYDADTDWSFAPDGKPSVNNVFTILRGLEATTWASVMQASGGRSVGTNSHYISIDKLCADAKRRANTICLDEKELFSLRLQGDVRLWGIIEPNGCFFVIWFDPNHKVYPV
jgi:hypothetical protein